MTTILRQLHWLPIKRRIGYKILVLVHKALYEGTPEYLAALLHQFAPRRCLRSAGGLLLDVPRVILERIGRRAFACAGLTLWNKLPANIRGNGNHPQFKKLLKTFLNFVKHEGRLVRGGAAATLGSVAALSLCGSSSTILPNLPPQRVLQVLEKYPISTFCATPTAYRMLVLENFAKYNLSSIRHCVSAGEPLNPEVIDQWLDATGTVIREGYGQTETVLQCGSFRCLPNKPGSMGKPAPGMDVRVIGEDGLEVGSGIEGDLAIRVLPDRPVGLFSCYVDEPEKTASTYQGDYYLTGDRAYRDDDGYMWFVGRSDDIILSAGYRIGPFEVESALLEHPAVVESAVVSSPHATRGEVVKAYVVLMTDYQNADKEALTSELQQLVKDITAPYKYPRKIEFIESLPKTISGKIRRVDLRSREWRKQQ
ncbi:Acyl-coenzyme A synthetase ACSM3, mitochondrial [Lamellibrachia satsuma]|nr:Acyl-coenzyme A synthetase ACSM3, mitochondrial [Lamellibrachia satsuma]